MTTAYGHRLISCETPIGRFMKRTTKTDGCWLWTGWIGKPGYGYFWIGEERRWKLAHRWMFEYAVGPIPSGLVLDHLCRVTHCVNPAHLEPVTDRENILRGEAPTIVSHRSGLCKRGHPLSVSTAPSRKGKHVCNVCMKARNDRRVQGTA